MKVTKKLELSKLLSMQSDQLTKFLDKIECKIPKLVEDLPVDGKLAFYKKVNSIYSEKLTKLQNMIKEK